MIRKNRPVTDGLRQTRICFVATLSASVTRDDLGFVFRLARPGAPSQGTFDLEIEIPKISLRTARISIDRHWTCRFIRDLSRFCLAVEPFRFRVVRMSFKAVFQRRDARGPRQDLRIFRDFPATRRLGVDTRKRKTR